ncbi:MAG: protein kinase [Myxococcota bacterium]
MARTYYCARCLNSFTVDAEACPNLGCGTARPPAGWGRLLQPGELLDRHYLVRERIAVGGAGITYRAREVDDDGEEVGPELAIKVLLQSDGTFLRRLGNEARVLQELHHAHIVESRGFVHRTGKPAYLVTTYEAGGNLYDHVRHAGALPVPVAAAVVEQILDALLTAHRRGVIHRDLKPQNVLLREVVGRDAVPHVLVADFGIAKLSGFMGDDLTRVGTFVGTPEFAAPEQFRGLPPEPASDVYAAACVLWFCITGAPPVRFTDRSDIVACLTTLRDALPPRLPDVVDEPLRSRLDALFAHTLLPKPGDRWSISALLDALASLDADADDFAAFSEESPSQLAEGSRQLGPPDAPTTDLSPSMGTLSPGALGGDAFDTPPPAPVAQAPAPRPAPRPEPALPALREPEPEERPRRMRLNARPDRAVSVEVDAAPVGAPSGMDALFESVAAGDGVIEVVNRREPDPMSLDDLFAPPPPELGAQDAPEPELRTPRPLQGSQSVLDASWETLATPSAPAGPEPAQPPPEAVGPAPAWSPTSPTPLPAPLPSDDGALLEVLGSCDPSVRGAVLAALSDGSRAVGSVGSGASAATLCGACLTVAAQALEGRAAWCRTLLTHSDADVRATAALAVGATGKAGQLTLLNRLLTDGEARVRLAAVHALKQLGDSTGRQDLVAGWLDPLRSDADPDVRAAAR